MSERKNENRSRETERELIAVSRLTDEVKPSRRKRFRCVSRSDG